MKKRRPPSGIFANRCRKALSPIVVMMGPGIFPGASTIKNENYFIIMKYTLRFTASDLDVHTRPQKAPLFWAAFLAYVQGIKESGVVLDGAGLQARTNGDYRPRARR